MKWKNKTTKVALCTQCGKEVDGSELKKGKCEVCTRESINERKINYDARNAKKGDGIPDDQATY